MKHTIILILSLCAMITHAQDVVYKTNGDSITNVAVVRFNNEHVIVIQDGKTYSIKAEKVSKMCTGKECVEYNQGKLFSENEIPYFNYINTQNSADTVFSDEYAGDALIHSGAEFIGATVIGLGTYFITKQLTEDFEFEAADNFSKVGNALMGITLFVAFADLIKAGKRLNRAEKRMRRLEKHPK